MGGLRPSLLTKGGDPMLKHYIVNGKEFQYEEGEQPKGAEEMKEGIDPSKEQEAPTKARKTANKARETKNK